MSTTAHPAHPADSSLPSGGLLDIAGMARFPLSHPTSAATLSPMMSQHLLRQQATSAPSSYPFPSHSPYLHSPTSVPISPPHTRSASAETTSAALVEDFRAYTQKLRDQYEGERAHIVADRARGMEVMAEERALWDKERNMLLARIRELEGRLQGVGEVVSPLGIFNLDMGNMVLNANMAGHAARVPNAGMSAHSPNVVPNLDVPSQPVVPVQIQRASSPRNAVPSSEPRRTPPSLLPHPHPDVKQESGRNADGSPFYAPAPQNPTRTFSTESETEALRVDDIIAPTETPLRVTSKELSASDFCGSNQVSPEADRASSTIRWAEGDAEEEEKESDIIGADSIDISHIAPHLEGVPIKASAVDPEFVARVLSPQCNSPAKLSPNIRPPGRDVEAKKTQAKVLGEAETRRLTMYAGHTPNHSISRFADLVKEVGVEGSELGDVTPRGNGSIPHPHHPSFVVQSNDIEEEEEEEEEEVDHIKDQEEDPALKGPLGLTNQTSKDELFLEVLTEKLQEVEKEISEKGSPNLEIDSLASWSPVLEMKSASRNQGESKGEGAEEGDGIPPLKLKPSMNFGRPMGVGF